METIIETNETKENNTMIAVFMGLTPKSKIFGKYSISLNHCTSRHETREETLKGFGSLAKFHTSWDWLMPVIKKVLEISSELDELERYHEVVDQIPDINYTHHAVVGFINWYNKTQKS